MHKVKFCWLCGNKLWGKHKEILSVDFHPRTLHKTCAKTVKKTFQLTNGTYTLINWVYPGSFTD